MAQLMAQKERITLYGFVTSPFVQKVNSYLVYKGLDFDMVHVDPIRPSQIRFTNQRQVPVLMIDNEWRVDSSPIGMWIDERFPDKPLMGKSKKERQKILEIDAWISDTYIPSMLFRAAYEWQSIPMSLYAGWRLSHILNKSRKLALPYRLLWPIAVKKAPFIAEMMRDIDLEEPVSVMRKRILNELKEHLAGGPFLGGFEKPSLADLSLYPIMITSYMTMTLKVMKEAHKAMLPKDPEIRAWLQNMAEVMPQTPMLADSSCVTKALPFS